LLLAAYFCPLPVANRPHFTIFVLMDVLHQHISGTELSWLDLGLLILYTLVCIGIGLWNSRKQADADFLIAGRSLGQWGFVTSVVASYIGGAAIVAYAAYVYNFGISAIAVFLGTSLGFLFFIPYARKLRRVGADQRFYTLSDWFYHKFGNGAGAVSAAILLFVYFGMLLNQFIAGSSILANITTTSSGVRGIYLQDVRALISGRSPGGSTHTALFAAKQSGLSGKHYDSIIIITSP
jgi:Na+/proline symporter